MTTGTVKWFDPKKGFGFILETTGRDVFVHHSDIEGDGHKTLNEGEIVNFLLVTGEKGAKAQQVKREP